LIPWLQLGSDDVYDWVIVLVTVFVELPDVPELPVETVAPDDWLPLPLSFVVVVVVV
jgi:hypothetical protein